MIEYSLTLDKVDNNSVHIIFNLKIFGYVLKNSRIVFARNIDSPNNSESIDFAHFIATRMGLIEEI